MGCTAPRQVVAQHAPEIEEKWRPQYGDRKGPYYVTNKDAEATIVFAAEGPSSEAAQPAQTFGQLFESAAKQHGDRVALRVERDEKGFPPPFDTKTKKADPALPLSQWVTWTWTQYFADCQRFGKSLVSLGVKQFGTVAIWGFNSPEWVIASMGSAVCGAKGAGIYPTDNKEQVQYKCLHSDADVICVEDGAKLAMIESIAGMLPELKAVVVWGPGVQGGSITGAKKAEIPVYTWTDFMSFHEKSQDDIEKLYADRVGSVRPGHCAALIYTSGTTGRPKAVMISHDNLIFDVSGVMYLVRDLFGKSGAEERIVSYLPLSHVAGMLVDMMCPLWLTANTPSWASLSFARPYDLKIGSIKDRLVAVKPTFFLGVPRVWEKIAEKMKALASHVTGFKLKIARWAKGKGLEHAQSCLIGGSGAKPPRYGLANFLVLRKVKLALGLEHCKFGLTGAAPIMKHTLEYYGSLGININEAYGMSECTGATTVSTNECHLWGSCGFALPGVEVSVFRVNPDDLNEKKQVPDAKDVFQPSEEEQGEICFRGRHVMMGYLANPSLGEAHVKEIQEKNSGAIDADGWLHSGDKGCRGTNGMFRITGRYKELIIGAGGENVAPVPIEGNIKRLCDAISNVMMFGDKKKFNVCLVTLKAIGASGQEPGGDELDGAARRVTSDVKLVSEAVRNPKFVEHIQDAIKKTNDDGKVCPSRASKIQKFSILPRDFSIATGEFTSTLKLKRSTVAKKYADILERMYTQKTSYVPYDGKTWPPDGKTWPPEGTAPDGDETATATAPSADATAENQTQPPASKPVAAAPAASGGGAQIGEGEAASDRGGDGDAGAGDTENPDGDGTSPAVADQAEAKLTQESS